MSATAAKTFRLALTDDEMRRCVLFAIEVKEEWEKDQRAAAADLYWLRFDSVPGSIEIGLRVGAAPEALTVVLDFDLQEAHIRVTPGSLRGQLRQVVQGALENVGTLQREAEHGGVDLALNVEALLDQLEGSSETA